MSKDSALRSVRESGGRLTVPTRIVVNVLAESETHLTAEDIIAEVERRTPGISASTIYRVINRLGELSVIAHVHTGVGPPVYHLHAGRHAHLVCNRCHEITDIESNDLDALGRALQRRYGFSIEPHHAALLGICANCTALGADEIEPHHHH